MSKCNPETFLYSKKKRALGVNYISEGQFGKVSRGCTPKKCFAIKQSSDSMKHEFSMMKLAYKWDPQHIPRPYEFVTCPNGSILYSQYIPSKSLLENPKKLTRRVLFTILQILYTLNKHGIHHNDFHPGNILVGKRVYITDFGHATRTRKTSVGVNLATAYASAHPSDMRHDYHGFLNLVYQADSTPPTMRLFIESLFPKKYLKKNSPVVFNWRLRPNVSHEQVPLLKNVLKSLYFKTN